MLVITGYDRYVRPQMLFSREGSLFPGRIFFYCFSMPVLHILFDIKVNGRNVFYESFIVSVSNFMSQNNEQKL